MTFRTFAAGTNRLSMDLVVQSWREEGKKADNAKE